MKILIKVIGVFLIINGYSQIIFDFEKKPERWFDNNNNPLVISKKYSFTNLHSLKIDFENSNIAVAKYIEKLNFADYSSITLRVFVPEDINCDVEFTCYIKDSEWNWFETEPVKILRGEEKKITLNLENSYLWKPVSHVKNWDDYVKKEINEFGFIFRTREKITGSVFIDTIEGVPEIKKRKLYLYNFRVNSERIKKYEKFEITFNLPITFRNPFNPEIKIYGVFTSPSGKVYTLPSFFYHDYLRTLYPDGEKLYSYGKSEWKIRFTPQEEGTYTYEIKAGEKTLYSGKFLSEKSEIKGFIRWDKKDRFYLSYSNGEFFYPIGHTLRSPDDKREPYPYEFKPQKNLGTFAYDNYFNKMAKNGENYARIWMGAWWVGIEWNSSYAPHYKGLGRYSLENSWKLDYLCEIAKRYGIYIDLTLINHGQFSIRPDAEWLDNPYNILNGGFLKSPDEFFVNEKAIKFFKRRLDYIVSRWSYSPSILFWELWNEVDLTGYYDTMKVRYWHKKIVPYLKKIDIYNHPISTHYCRRDEDPLVWVIPEISSLISNSYHSEIVDSVKRFYLKRKPFGKPVMINEFGVGKNRYLLEDNLHGGIWASSMTPMFGVGLFWWWPFIDHFNLYFHYRALSEFWKGIDRRNKNFQLSDAETMGETAEVIGIQNEKEGYFWVYDKKVFNTPIKRLKKVVLKKVKLKIYHLLEGNYKIEFWDTYEGKKIKELTVKFKKRENEIILPDFVKDIAIKIKRIE